MDDIATLRQRLRQAVERSAPATSDYDLTPSVVLPEGRKLRPAGVLIAISPSDSGSNVLLTKRSSALKHHPGQIAFPGGKVDPNDDGPVGAALREAEEEIGLPRDAVDIVGTLPFHETVTSFKATPVIGIVTRSVEFIAEPGEVDEVFQVPLPHLMARENFSIQSRLWRGQSRSYFTVPWGPYYIWGATARMLRALADRMAHDSN